MLCCHGDGGTTGCYNNRRMTWFVSKKPNGDFIKEYRCSSGPLQCGRTVPYEKVLNWTITNSASMMKKCVKHGSLKIFLFDVPRATATQQCANVDEEAQSWATSSTEKAPMRMPTTSDYCRSYGCKHVEFLAAINHDLYALH